MLESRVRSDGREVAAMISKEKKEKFDRLYLKELTKQQHKVLKRLLQGKTERSIATEINIKDCTVRSHISKIAKTFKIFNENGQHIQKRELIQLFCQYKPELVSEQVKSEYWDSPCDRSPESNSDLKKNRISKMLSNHLTTGRFTAFNGKSAKWQNNSD